MIKKIVFSILFVLLFFGHDTYSVAAKEPNVADCLTENADCEDTDQIITPGKDSSGDEDKTDSTTSNFLFFDIVKMVFALLLVLVLIYILLKFISRKNKLFHQIKVLENLGGITVGTNKSIQIVRVGSKLYLIGVGDNVEMLQEITDEDIKNEIIENIEEKNMQSGSMLPAFLQTNRKYAGNKQVADFKGLFATELDKLKKNRHDLINQHIQKEDK